MAGHQKGPSQAMCPRPAVDGLSDLDLSYTPPLGGPWDAIQMAPGPGSVARARTADEWLPRRSAAQADALPARSPRLTGVPMERCTRAVRWVLCAAAGVATTLSGEPAATAVPPETLLSGAPGTRRDLLLRVAVPPQELIHGGGLALVQAPATLGIPLVDDPAGDVQTIRGDPLVRFVKGGDPVLCGTRAQVRTDRRAIRHAGNRRAA
jgi:hypothetical protein